MKQLKWLLAAAGMLTVLTACSSAATETPEPQDPPPAESAGTQTPEDAAWNTITAEEAKARIDSGDPVTVVDVRTAAEYEEGHIEHALLLPNEEIGSSRPALLPDPDAELLVYCRTGRRSAEAAKKLAALGYTNVSDFGGITDWPYGTVEGAFETPEALKAPGVLSEFSAEDLYGNPVDSSIFAGYPINMINVWATFCGPCINEMPDLGELAAEYADRGVQIIGVVSDLAKRDGTYDEELTELARDIVEATGAAYLHLMPSPDLVEKKLQNIQAVPTTFFVDETGAAIGSAYVVGAQSKSDWEATLDALLAELEETP